jgi:FkbM family methyltransferase
MKKKDRVRLDFTRNWKMPGKEKLARWLKPSKQIGKELSGGIIWPEDEDIAIYTTADNFIEWKILTIGTYENEINKLIRLCLKPGSVALDIGGNIGLQSIRMSQCVGSDGQVIAFEPLKHLQERFKKNIALNKIFNVLLMPYALSDADSDQELKFSPLEWNQGSFSLAGKPHGTETQLVQIKKGDALPEIQALKRLDLIKIDVEGFEYRVLKGLTNTLEKFRPRIIFEYNVNYWAANGLKLNDCFAFLQQVGYKLYQVYPAGCQPLNSAEEAEGGNIFCINE